MITHLFLDLDPSIDGISGGSAAVLQCKKALFYYGKRGHCDRLSFLHRIYFLLEFDNFVSKLFPHFLFLFFGPRVVSVEAMLFLYCVESSAFKNLSYRYLYIQSRCTLPKLHYIFSWWQILTYHIFQHSQLVQGETPIHSQGCWKVVFAEILPDCSLARDKA